MFSQFSIFLAFLVELWLSLLPSEVTAWLGTLVAPVTGGSSGIGLEIARQLGLHGSGVVAMGRRESVIESGSTALKSEGILVGAQFNCFKFLFIFPFAVIFVRAH